MNNSIKKYIKYDSYLLVLSNESETKKYEKVVNYTRHDDNYLRLFATEIDFLNRCYKLPDNKSILIYISSSNNIDHIYKIIQLYPEIEYHIYNLSIIDYNLPNVKIYNRIFTFDDIQQYKDSMLDIYVISNFENENIKDNIEYSKKEELLGDDLDLQMKLLKELNPNSGAYLKFRLPHFIEDKLNPLEDNLISYFQGIVFKTIFSKIKTSECRLYVKDFNLTTEWNYKKLNEQMYYYNDIIRETIVNNPIINGREIIKKYDNNFDSMILLWILKDYLRKRSYSFPTEDELMKLYNYVSERT